MFGPSDIKATSTTRQQHLFHNASRLIGCSLILFSALISVLLAGAIGFVLASGVPGSVRCVNASNYDTQSHSGKAFGLGSSQCVGLKGKMWGNYPEIKCWEECRVNPDEIRCIGVDGCFECCSPPGTTMNEVKRVIKEGWKQAKKLGISRVEERICNPSAKSSEIVKDIHLEVRKFICDERGSGKSMLEQMRVVLDEFVDDNHRCWKAPANSECVELVESAKAKAEKCKEMFEKAKRGWPTFAAEVLEKLTVDYAGRILSALETGTSSSTKNRESLPKLSVSGTTEIPKSGPSTSQPLVTNNKQSVVSPPHSHKRTEFLDEDGKEQTEGDQNDKLADKSTTHHSIQIKNKDNKLSITNNPTHITDPQSLEEEEQKQIGKQAGVYDMSEHHEHGRDNGDEHQEDSTRLIPKKVNRLLRKEDKEEEEDDDENGEGDEAQYAADLQSKVVDDGKKSFVVKFALDGNQMITYPQPILNPSSAHPQPMAGGKEATPHAQTMDGKQKMVVDEKPRDTRHQMNGKNMDGTKIAQSQQITQIDATGGVMGENLAVGYQGVMGAGVSSAEAEGPGVGV